MNYTVRRIGTYTALALILGITGCQTTTTKKSETSVTAAGVEGTGPVPEEKEPSVRNSLLESNSNLQTVHFDYDSSKLSTEALTILAKNAGWLREHDQVIVQVSGHCDQRGTDSYNLALGERRAKAVRDYYGRLGIHGRRVATISYGHEKLTCREENEACWEQNRRAETLTAVSKSNAKGPNVASPSTP
jgi:peptidoglycan-associated lipoprotein